jgi:hypothetical protein
MTEQGTAVTYYYRQWIPAIVLVTIKKLEPSNRFNFLLKRRPEGRAIIEIVG